MTASKIVISGYYGFGNAGDEAMLTAILGALYERDPNLDITVISGAPAKTQARHDVRAVSRLHFPNIWQAIYRADLLLSGGGSLLQDVTSRRSLYYYLSIMRVARWLNTKVFLYAQGIGPLVTEKARHTVRTILNTADFITVRDEASARLLQEIGVSVPPVRVTADAVLAMRPAQRSVGRRLLETYGVDFTAPRIGISVRSWRGQSEFKHRLALVADRLAEETGATIIFLPMQHPEDVTAAHEVAAFMQAPSIVLSDLQTTTEIMGVIGCMDVILGIRLHALIFAALMQVPVAGISYDPKVTGFLHAIGEDPVAEIEAIDVAAVTLAVKDRLQRGCFNEIQKTNIEALKKKSEATADFVLQVMKTGGRTCRH